MVLNIRNREADVLARQLAELDGSSITDAVVSALREAIDSRRRRKSSAEVVRSILASHGIALTDAMRRPVDASVWSDLHDDPGETA